MDEPGFIQGTFNSILNQSYRNFHIYVCINQYDSWWNDNQKKEICNSNELVYKALTAIDLPELTLVDRYSPGKGWPPKKGGAGRARKVIMDHINSVAGENELIVSMDADTVFNPGYFQDVVSIFNQNPKAVALSVPYYHCLANDPGIDRAMLRYEIYLRYFALNMLRIRSPYSFTPLGSAIVLPVWAYRAVSGITPFLSGEDFYFLQKLVKYGKVLQYSKEIVYPSARPSDRVIFGTGPAIIKGLEGNWSSSPFYPVEFFGDVKNTCKLFGRLYRHDVATPMDDFFKAVFREENIWQPLRSNYTDVENFKRACAAKIDGLRILQYLKFRQKNNTFSDEHSLLDFIKIHFGEEKVLNFIPDTGSFNFANAGIQLLDNIRNLLFDEEMKIRKRLGPLFLNNPDL